MMLFLVEDETDIRETLGKDLKRQGFAVRLLSTLSEARTALEQALPALLLLDWNLPDGPGDRFCHEVRQRWPDLPILFLTVRSDTRDIVTGLRAGADDYVVKPFDLDVLHARIQALLRRTGTSDLLICGPLRMDTATGTVSLEGEELFLTPLERSLLELLLRSRGKTVSRDRLLRLWDDQGTFVNDNTLSVAMRRLREKLRHPTWLKTVRSIGYRLEEPS